MTSKFVLRYVLVLGLVGKPNKSGVVFIRPECHYLISVIHFIARFIKFRSPGHSDVCSF
jgi:hypothetical protein